MENRVVEAIQKRRSVRSFEERIPDQNLIDEVMEAGLYAASGRGTQGTVIVQIDNKKLGKEIRELNAKIGGWPANFDPFYSAPVILIVLANKNISTHVYDGSLVMGNLMLAADAVGLGSCWIHRAKEEFETEQGKTWLKEWGLEGEWEGIGHLALGYAKGTKSQAAPRKEGRIITVK